MALSGTLKDFGIADIFQLISHQSKTGVLNLRSRGEEVRVFFVRGNVVRAESSTRKQKDLLGSMLVRAEVINDVQLEQALETQKRTLKKLGHIMVEQGFLTLPDLREFTRLQTTETIYRLFAWDSGTYAFDVEEVAYDEQTIEPIRSENILMEGFRMVDEWPMVRKRIGSFEMTFKKVRPLPEQKAAAEVEDEIDAAFDGMTAVAEKASRVGANETRVYGLVEESRSVQKIIDLARLGEFETCKALVNLLEQDFIKVDAVKKEAGAAKPGRRLRSISLGRLLVQLAMYAVIVGVALLLYQSVDMFSFFGEEGTNAFRDPAAAELLDFSHRARLENALEIYRLEQGGYPDNLEALARAGLLSENRLRFPWKEERVYRRLEGGFLLLRPFE